MTIGYREPQPFYTGQILGRGNVGVLADNDEYFYGLARRWHCVPRSGYYGWFGPGEANRTIWNGHIFYESGVALLHYTLWSNADDIHTELWIGESDNFSSTRTRIATAENKTVTGTFDMRTKPWTLNKLHRIWCRIHRDDTNSQGIGTCRAPYLTHTGEKYYRPGYSIVDGAIGKRGHFNRLRRNDQYFYVCTPRQPAFAGMRQSADSGTLEIWRGRIHHKWHRLHYYVYLSNGASGNKLRIRYDRDGNNDTIVDIGSSGETMGSKQINTSSDWMTSKLLTAELIIDGGGTSVAEVFYLYIGPDSTNDPQANYKPMGAFRPDQWVYGDTAGQDTRLSIFKSNDAHIFKYMCWNAAVGRMDYAVAAPYTWAPDSGTTPIIDKAGDYRLVRRYDTLYYRIEGGQMTWGGGEYSHALENYDSANPYHTLDLKALDTLEYGQVYRLTADDDAQNLQFAMER